MTAKAALCKALLAGETLNIKNCFEMIGITNAPREISRMIEQPFGVVIFRTKMEGKSRYGKSVIWFNYRLPRIKENALGIQKMVEYLAEHSEFATKGAITERESKTKWYFMPENK